MRTELESAVEILRDIASMGRKAGSETARNWLYMHGYAETAGGYIPGVGFEDSDSVREPVANSVGDAGTVTGTYSDGSLMGQSRARDNDTPRDAGSIPARLTNQCDGCRAGLPKRNDRHYAQYANGEEYPEMYCTRRLYE